MYLNNKALKIIEENYTKTGSKIGAIIGSNLGLAAGGLIGGLAGLELSNNLVQRAQQIQDPNFIETIAQQYPQATEIALDALNVPFGIGAGLIGGTITGGVAGSLIGGTFGNALDIKKKIYDAFNWQSSRNKYNKKE